MCFERSRLQAGVSWKTELLEFSQAEFAVSMKACVFLYACDAAACDSSLISNVPSRRRQHSPNTGWLVVLSTSVAQHQINCEDDKSCRKTAICGDLYPTLLTMRKDSWFCQCRVQKSSVLAKLMRIPSPHCLKMKKNKTRVIGRLDFSPGVRKPIPLPLCLSVALVQLQGQICLVITYNPAGLTRGQKKARCVFVEGQDEKRVENTGGNDPANSQKDLHPRKAQTNFFLSTLPSRALLLTRSDSTSHSAMWSDCPSAGPPWKWDFWATRAILSNFHFQIFFQSFSLFMHFSMDVSCYPECSKFFWTPNFSSPKIFLLSCG